VIPNGKLKSMRHIWMKKINAVLLQKKSSGGRSLGLCLTGVRDVV
jgi:hypothetical protein